MIFASNQEEMEFKVFNDRIDITRTRPLNPAYIRIAGHPERFDKDFLELRETGGDLITLQEKHSLLGYKMAELIKTGRGWSVYINGAEELYSPSEENILFNLPDAIDAGIQWANDDVDHREFIVRKDLIS